MTCCFIAISDDKLLFHTDGVPISKYSDKRDYPTRHAQAYFLYYFNLLYTILAFLSAIGLKHIKKGSNFSVFFFFLAFFENVINSYRKEILSIKTRHHFQKSFFILGNKHEVT